MFRAGGVDADGLESMRASVADPANTAEFFGGPTPVLTVGPGATQAAAVADLGSAELCNVLYFAVLPRRLLDAAANRTDLPAIAYTYGADGGWAQAGDGPYFVSPTAEQVRVGSPEEGLQVFISERGRPLPPGGITSLSDTALLGPNSEASLLFTRRREFGRPRFAISSISSSNRLRVNIADFNGYWLQYALHLSYASFVEVRVGGDTRRWRRSGTAHAPRRVSESRPLVALLGD